MRFICFLSAQVMQQARSATEHVLVQEPEEVMLPEAIMHASAGHYHTLCLSEAGNIWSMGSNGHGQLGLGRDLACSASPRLVRALAGVTALATPSSTNAVQPLCFEAMSSPCKAFEVSGRYHCTTHLVCCTSCITEHVSDSIWKWLVSVRRSCS